jgi:hypothetical protein
LTHIEAGAFNMTSLSSVVVPGGTSFIVGDAFPRCCAVRFSG